MAYAPNEGRPGTKRRNAMKLALDMANLSVETLREYAANDPEVEVRKAAKRVLRAKRVMGSAMELEDQDADQKPQERPTGVCETCWAEATRRHIENGEGECVSEVYGNVLRHAPCGNHTIPQPERQTMAIPAAFNHPKRAALSSHTEKVGQ